MADRLADLQELVRDLVRREPGLKIAELAERLGVPTEMAKLVVRPLVGVAITTTGRKRGTRYYVVDPAT